MEEGRLHPAPIWSNVRTFDGKPWRGVVDWIAGGFPCQPFSVAGKRRGEEDPRHLWPEFVRIIGEVRPRLVFLENVPGVVKLGGASIASDLADLGYRFAWTTLRASDVGAPHHRRRWFCVADAYGEGEPRIPILPKVAEFSTVDVPNTDDAGCRKQRWTLTNETKHQAIERLHWWAIEPGVRRVVDGMADRMDRLRACGNGVVPQQAEAAFRYLIECLNAVD
jgi:DNA (cytosine-5)-methyltransferase 1